MSQKKKNKHKWFHHSINKYMKESCFNFSIVKQYLPTVHVTARCVLGGQPESWAIPNHLSTLDWEGWIVFISDKGFSTSKPPPLHLPSLIYAERIPQTFKQFRLPSPLGSLLNNPGKHISCDLLRSWNNSTESPVSELLQNDPLKRKQWQRKSLGRYLSLKKPMGTSYFSNRRFTGKEFKYSQEYLEDKL